MVKVTSIERSKRKMSKNQRRTHTCSAFFFLLDHFAKHQRFQYKIFYYKRWKNVHGFIFLSFLFFFFASHLLNTVYTHTHVYTIHIYLMLYWISRAHIHTTMLYCIARQCLRFKTFVFCCTFCETEKILKCSLSLSLRCLLSVPQLTLQAESYKISRLSWCRFVKLISIVRHQVFFSSHFSKCKDIMKLIQCKKHDMWYITIPIWKKKNERGIDVLKTKRKNNI